ncbi:MAG TPA: hypothetical protein VNC61_16250 [Acidimicrobiales bacterium]|nr:hypothetical protein [Acidimicrobiales bacterium]
MALFEDTMRDSVDGGPADFRFAPAIVLTKREAFEACEICADAERSLLRAGRAAEAARLATLFELFENRLVVQGTPGQDRSAS